MELNILLFGQLTDIAGAATIKLQDIADTDELASVLQDLYPALQRSKYMMAVDKKLVTENTLITSDCTVALLPPYSGG